MLTATNRQAISASNTASGMLPPAYGTPTMMEKATAAAGAMWVMDWNRVGAKPTAFRSSRCASTDVPIESLPPFRREHNTSKEAVATVEPELAVGAGLSGVFVRQRRLGVGAR